MTDADYFLDLSSPDPLADGIPSSVRPSTRRITKSHQDLASFSAPRSSARGGLRTQSPKKRTFQLNLGDDRSPQRIRVTVESADTLKRDDVNRKLFAPSSPTRSARRRETITTTSVPLNDDPAADSTTPLRRGRQRRTSNGTPMPRGRKRAGTPVRRASKFARLEDDAPSSEAAILDDTLMDMGGDGSEEMPKSRTKPRKTPKKTPRKTPRKPPASASAPSSQLPSGTTSRKRRRTRNAPVSEEPDVTDTGHETIGATRSAPISSSNTQPSLRGSLDAANEGVSSGHVEDYAAQAMLKAPARRRSGITSSLHPEPLKEPAGIGGPEASPASSLRESVRNDDPMMSEDYQGMELHSDVQSEASEASEARYDRQDTIAEASEFSMIALESLPSFQASFQGAANEPTSDQHEMGEETSRIVNETLESLRRSLQTETEGHLHTVGAENDSRRDENRSEDRDRTLNQSTATETYIGDRGSSRSQGSLKPLPLSRQVLVGRGNVDDSFSTIPDSILHATTPGRLPMKLTASEEEHHDGQVGTYGDSFSEVPSDVPEAATPKPLGRVETLPRGSSAEHEERHSASRPAVRMSNTSYGSGRLPTPDETSSSNAGSKKTHEEDTEASLEPQEHTQSIHETDVPSSPPVRTQPRALDHGPSNLQRELDVDGTQKKQLSSPQRQSPSKTSSNQLPSLELPLPGIRPSLSPIVRVGRTLQNVLSDNSSPEGRESSLRSPFRGSASSDRSRQLSIARSPSPSIRHGGVLNNSQPPRPNLEKKLERASQSSLELQASGIESSKNSRTEPQRDSKGQQSHGRVAPVGNTSMTSSTTVDPPTNDGGRWAADSSRKMNGQQTSFQRETYHRQNSTGMRDTGMAGAATAHKTDFDPEQDKDHNELMQDLDEDPGDKFEEHNDYDDDDDVDIWDIEASRTSPVRPEPTHTEQKSSKPSKSDLPPKRSKVPSPWRRNSRRLIYKDDIATSSQIEIEESSQSEIEENPPVPTSQSPVSQPQQDTQIPAEDPVPVQKSPVQKSPVQKSPALNSPMEKSPKQESFTQKSPMQEEIPERMNIASPNHSDGNFEEYAGPADYAEPDDDDLVQQEELGPPEQVPDGPPLMDDEQMERDAQEELEDFYRAAAPDAPRDVAEHSSVVEQATQTAKVQETPLLPKPKFFGGFDILSFFSSPATLPRFKAGEPKSPAPGIPPAISQPVLEPRQPREPPKGLWSTGLFPSIPPTEFRPNTERRSDPFSPGSALRSSDTVPDTYDEPSETVSPPPGPHGTSASPSTPEREAFPPIPQKRDFTPRPRQSREPLFAPDQSTPSPIQENIDDDDDLQESSDEQESSGLTEGSEYERVPPREQPSRWDRHLSPTKSCLRSPLKPPAQGRVVAFTNNAPPSPQSQSQAHTLQSSNNAQNTIAQGPPLRPRLEGKENQPPPSTKSPANNDSTGPSSAMISSQPLSQTTWTRNHWTRLDDMIQLRRSDPQRFAQSRGGYERGYSSALLGKEVSAQGARLVLEPWHLDVVEAFREEVGGWDERSLAKRVFALIVGAERRGAR